MDQLIPPLAALRAPFRDCFRAEAFQTSQVLAAGGIIGLGPRTLSAVWQATGLAARRHHDTAYAAFHSAAWEGDDLGSVLATLILTPLVPGGVARLVVDDTLGHQRGAEVAFGGIFLDAVLTPKQHKTRRCGLNGVGLGIAAPVPLRPDRSSCLPVLWRLYRERGPDGYQTRPQAAAAPARERAEADPGRTFWLVGDGASVNAALLRGRPANLRVIGPLPWEAALYERPGPYGGQGRPPEEGRRLPAPPARIEDEAAYPAEVLKVASPTATRALRGPGIRAVLGSRGSKGEPVPGVLVRDPAGQGRDEALVATDPAAAAACVILGYGRRWGGGRASFDSQPSLGRHDPRVRGVRGVERAHPMAWFIGALTVLCYCRKGLEGSHVARDRPWYTAKVTPTFTDMPGALRLPMWESKVLRETGEDVPAPECVESLLHQMAAVA